MLTTRTILAATALTVATALPSASAVAASTTYPASNRPHSRVVTYDGDILVRRLQMSLTRKDHRLHGVVRMTLRNETGHALTRELRVGPCVGGITGYPYCRTDATFRVRVPAHVDVPMTRSITLHQPPAGIDSVQAAIVKPGARQPYAVSSRSAGGSLLLRGTAWRGNGAGRLYGVKFHSDDARRLSFDIPATSRGSAYVDVKWTGSAAPSGATTTISRCTGDDCKSATLHPTDARSGPQTFGQRFDYAIEGADALGLAAGPANAPLFDATLPWPG